MTITNGYCTLDEWYARWSALASGEDAARDSKVEDHIEAASRWIDQQTATQFFATTDTRYFTAEKTTRLKVVDLLTVTTLKTDDDGDRTYETTWQTTDYDLMPYNYTPYQWIEVTPQGSYFFPLTRKGVEIAGTWGYYSSAPADIKEACLMQAARYYARETTILGQSGTTTLGTITLQVPSDKDIRDLLVPYLKRM